MPSSARFSFEVHCLSRISSKGRWQGCVPLRVQATTIEGKASTFAPFGHVKVAQLAGDIDGRRFGAWIMESEWAHEKYRAVPPNTRMLPDTAHGLDSVTPTPRGRTFSRHAAAGGQSPLLLHRYSDDCRSCDLQIRCICPCHGKGIGACGCGWCTWGGR